MNASEAAISSARAWLAAGRAAEARDLLVKSLTGQPNSIEFWQVLGEVELELKNYGASIDCFRKIISLDPDNLEALVNVAFLSLKLNRVSDFKEALGKARRLNPGLAEHLVQQLGILSASPEPNPQGLEESGRSLTLPTPPAPLRREIPVVVLQLGSQPYLIPVLTQAKRSNAEVILIADHVYEEMKDTVTFVNSAAYAKEARSFERIYEHLSTNPYINELFCFQRWFVLKQYMERRNLKVCLHIDSDVLLYADAVQEFVEKSFDRYEFMLVHGHAASTSYFTYEGLARFCEFVRAVYGNKKGELFQSCLRMRAETAHQPGGVCDMTLLDMFRKQPGSRVGEMTEVLNNSTHDHNMNVSDGYEMIGSIKRIYTRGGDGFPYCKRLEDGRFIRFHSLHFQGQAKAALVSIAEQLFQSKKPARLEIGVES